MNTHTTPTFRVADGMLVENAREIAPLFCEYLDSPSMSLYSDVSQFHKAEERYKEHLDSLRSIPIAPGCVFEGESLREGVDFVIHEQMEQADHSYTTELKELRMVKYAIKIEQPVTFLSPTFKATHMTPEEKKTWQNGYLIGWVQGLICGVSLITAIVAIAKHLNK